MLVDICDVQGVSVLLYVCGVGQCEVVQCLFDVGVDILFIVQSGMIVLVVVVVVCCEVLVMLLLEYQVLVD